MKVSIKNYQILKQIALEFKPGFTALIGPSNNGKSSVLKAIKAAAYTEPGTTPIRHGTDSYIVGIQNNNHVVMYQKKEGNTKYVVDGEKYSKFGFNTPEEVSNALNIKELQVNGNKIQLNFWDQMEKPFLLDKTAGEMFKFIADSGDNDQLSSVLKSMVSDRQELNREADTIQGSIKSVEDTIKEQENSIEKLKLVLDKADTIIDLKEKYEDYKAIASMIENIKNNDKIVEELRPKLLYYTGKFDSYNICRYLISEKLNVMTKIRNDVKQYNSIDLTLHNEQELLDLEEKKMSIFARFNLSRIKSLVDIITRYKIINHSIENEQEEILKLQRNVPNDILKEKLSLQLEIRKNIFEIKAKLDVEIRNQENIVDAIERQEKDIIELKNSIKVCPLCGQKIGGNEEHDIRKDIS